MIRAIAAVDEKLGIAANGGIPWTIPEDGQYFRQQTETGIVLMGKDTYEEFAEPLPNRRNIVASRHLRTAREGFEIVNDVNEFLQNTLDDVWIIGGAGLYTSTLHYCDELYLTHIEGDFNCDRFFPVYADGFSLLSQSSEQVSGNYRFRFAVYASNKNR